MELAQNKMGENNMVYKLPKELEGKVTDWMALTSPLYKQDDFHAIWFEYTAKKITPDDAKNITKSRGLTHLTIRAKEMDYETLEILATIPTIVNLDFEGCKIPKKSLELLPRFKYLMSLNLEKCGLHGDALCDLPRMENLASLNLCKNKMSKNAYKHIEKTILNENIHYLYTDKDAFMKQTTKNKDALEFGKIHPSKDRLCKMLPGVLYEYFEDWIDSCDDDNYHHSAMQDDVNVISEISGIEKRELFAMVGRSDLVGDVTAKWLYDKQKVPVVIENVKNLSPHEIRLAENHNLIKDILNNENVGKILKAMKYTQQEAILSTYYDEISSKPDIFELIKSAMQDSHSHEYNDRDKITSVKLFDFASFQRT